jgi:Tfp pilus assembly protein PilX
MASQRRSWSGEEGLALILAMFMVLVVSLLGAALVATGRTETLSSLNYKSLSQARYAAESGLHSAANYLIHSYVAPGTDAGDPLVNYNMTVSPVTYNGKPVVLSTTVALANYPIDAKVTAFSNNSHGTLKMSTSHADYSATARLLSMRQFNDAYSGLPVTIQTWEITGSGNLDGAGDADVQVTAIIEKQTVPAFRYAAFSTYPGCSSMQFGGGGTTNSYSSTAALGAGGTPVTSDNGGNVGSNGNLSLNGNAVINGKLSTPRSGVGGCTANNVTAETVAGNGSLVTGDGCLPLPDCALISLPQQITMPDPAVISPMPPTTDVDLKKVGGCPADAGPYCAASADGVTFTPATPTTVVSMGNVNLNAGAVIRLNAGIYEWNSIKANGNAELVIDSGPVIFRIAGKDVATPIDLTGGVISNTTYKPTNLQFVFAPDAVDKAAIEAGTLSKEVKINGGAAASALVYAPKADGTLTGGSHLYGAVIFRKVKDMGGTAISYDRNLQNEALTSGNPTMTSFNWSSY